MTQLFTLPIPKISSTKVIKKEWAQARLQAWKKEHRIKDADLRLPHDLYAHALPEPPNAPTAQAELRGGFFDYVAKHYKKHGRVPPFNIANHFGYNRALNIAKTTYGVRWLQEPDLKTKKQWYSEAVRQVPTWYKNE